MNLRPEGAGPPVTRMPGIVEHRVSLSRRTTLRVAMGVSANGSRRDSCRFSGFVHGFVGALGSRRPDFARGDLGHSRAEGDQGLPVIVHKDLPRQLAATGSKH